jgi:hypothetical protein
LVLPTIAQITLFFISFLFPKNILVLNYWLWKAEPSEMLGTTTERVIPAFVFFVISIFRKGTNVITQVVPAVMDSSFIIYFIVIRIFCLVLIQWKLHHADNIDNLSYSLL